MALKKKQLIIRLNNKYSIKIYEVNIKKKTKCIKKKRRRKKETYDYLIKKIKLIEVIVK